MASSWQIVILLAFLVDIGSDHFNSNDRHTITTFSMFSKYNNDKLWTVT